MKDVLTVDALSTIMLLMAVEAMYPGMRLIHVFLDNGKRGLMAAYQSAYKMWDRSRRHSEDRQVSIKE
jgi:hypothetical protein